MTAKKQLLHLMLFSIGAIGVVVCIAGIVAVLLFGHRLNRATGNVFAQIDTTLVTVRERIDSAEHHVRAAKITSEELKQGLANWTKAEAKDRLAVRLGVEEKAHQLSSGLEQADQWLGFANSSVSLVQQGVELANSVGFTVDTESTARLATELESLGDQLVTATELVERIRIQAGGAGQEESLRGKIEQAIPLALRIVASLGSIDSRLGDLKDRVATTRINLEEMKAKSRRWIMAVTIAIVILLIWMSAGQVALCILSQRL